MHARLRGIFPPIPTSFDSSGDIDTQAVTANVTRWMKTRLSGLLVLGSNGESSLLDEDESDAVLAAARKAVPSGKLLIAGTGRESTRATIDASKRAAALGADAVLVRPPAYYKNQMTNDALVDHFRRVADESPVPVLLYNLPASGVVLTLPVVSALCQHQNVAGMKETSPELERLGQFTALKPGFSVVSGWAPVILPALSAGAAGGILAIANVFPEKCVDLYEHFCAGRYAQALEIQRAITPLAQMVTSIHGIAGLKVALTHLGYQVGPCRAPLQPLSDPVKSTITRAVDALAN